VLYRRTNKEHLFLENKKKPEPVEAVQAAQVPKLKLKPGQDSTLGQLGSVQFSSV